ncbi:non-ribosomal peptide synthetase [Serratia fonticola]|uniref:Amino acid adenylation domain-containing protein n=2 Tax=Serratia fonticola TaxID=47917 RepID=A0AAW3WR24_SERFO|nr:non-ribosomal peptide synthetase [Serratia fonticola]MBC3212057.1 amino acid adenylation domain-containing protein [Serratia fonticola]NYA10945.1 amino acid adenylation domain-containing protein [Serratia fonticola]NYA32923.1 amino acid adenylation domain-containing protein [Serratia fonticola]
MRVMQESAKRIGLKLSGKENDLITHQVEHSVEKNVIKINELLNGKLPVDDSTTFDKTVERKEDESFSLTDIQYAYLIGRNAGIPLGGIATHYYFEVEIFNPDLQRLNAALNHTLSLHAMLRAELIDSGRQRISAALEHYEIAVTDCQYIDDNQLQEFINSTRSDMKTHLRSLAIAPSFEIRATLLNKKRVRLHLCFDLMFIDLHSVKIVMKDWWHFYQNPNVVKSVPEFNFRDYIEREKQLLQSKQGCRDKDYWLNKVDTMPAAPELPLYQAPELIKNPIFKTLSHPISLELVNKLRQSATEQGITLETLFLGVYVETLRLWSRRQNFTLTLTQHARRNYFPDVQQSVGNYLQSSLLCVEDGKSEAFGQRLVMLQTEQLLNYWHSSFNGIQVLREMTRLSQGERALSFPVVFSNTLNAELRDIVTDYGWEGTAMVKYSSTQTPGVWLENQLLRINGDLVMNWNYVEGLFPVGMPEMMFEAAVKLLNACGENPQIWSQQGAVVALNTDDMQERLAANSTDDRMPLALLQDLILHSARQFPTKTAIIQGQREISYGELVTSGNLVAEQLSAAIAIEPGDIVAVSLPQGPEMLAAILGVLFAGAAYVSIDPQLPEQRKARLIERCAAKAIVTPAGLEPIDGLTNIGVVIDSAAPMKFPVQVAKQTLDDLAYVIFTSGSTGEPKGVMITHRNAANTVLDINRRFNVNQHDRVFSVAPAGFDLSVYDYFGVLGAGGSILFATENEANDPKIWAEKITKHRVTLWNSVPAPMKALVERAGSQLSGSALRLVLMSGDWIPVNLPDQIKAAVNGIDVISLGGATEGSIWSIVYPIRHVDSAWKSIPYGKPLANQKFHVFNEWFEPCPKWVIGELFIAGAGVAQGYLGDAEKTQERFFSHPITGERLYRTGDLGRYIDEGLIEILGREDNQVKINGYRIELGEIEACLLGNPQANHVVINAVNHPKTGQKQLAAYIVPKQQASENEKRVLEGALRELAQAHLPSYMIPTWFVLLDSMPLTGNGKIDRNALPVPWGEWVAVADKSEPADELEACVFALWSKQLQHSDFDVNDGFFDIGGDSLHAVGLLSAVREIFKVGPSSEQDMIESLFMNASVRDFSRILSSVADKAQEQYV